MFERYTERARRVLFFARYEATQAGALSIEPEHLLLGIAREGRGAAARVFEHANLSLPDLRRALVDGAGAASPKPVSGTIEIPFSPRTKRALTQAAAEADALGSAGIGTEHLLLAVLHETEGAAAMALARAGLDLAKVRAQVAQLARETTAGSDIANLNASGPALQARIAPSSRPFERGISSSRDLDRWSFDGFFFKPLLAKIFEIPESQMDLRPGLPLEERFDAAVALPYRPAGNELRRLLQQSLEAYFRVSITVESRQRDVYVLTAPHGFRGETESAFGGGGLMSASSPGLDDKDREELSKMLRDGPPDPEVLRRVKERFQRLVAGTAAGAPFDRLSGTGSIDILCDLLERHLDRPIVNETGLTASYKFALKSEAKSIPEFLAALEAQLGLVATPAVRNITMLVVR